MKQTRITRSARAPRRRAVEPLAPLPTRTTTTVAAGNLLGRIDRVLTGR